MTEPHLVTLGRFVAELRDEHVPEATRRAARYQMLNMVAALHASARSEEAASILPGLAGFAGAGRATSLADGRTLAPHDAARANAAFSMAQDFDDIVWMGHTCHSAVFASLAVAEQESADARTMLLGAIVANELGGRLGASSFFGPLNGQMWTFVHAIGAAAAASKVLGLTAEQTTHALAIALAQPTFALQPGFMTPTSKLLAASTPTATGIEAAYFARAGMTGATNLLEDPRGFWARFSYLPFASMLGGLGSFWATETLTIKTVPGCHYFQTACTAVDELERDHGRLDPDAIASVEAATTKLGFEATRFASEYSAKVGEVTPINVNFDLSVTLAIRILTGRLTSAEVHPEFLTRESARIRALAARITMVHDPALSVRTIGSVRALGEGSRALSTLGPRTVWKLAKRYREDYRSELAAPSELASWARALLALRGDVDRTGIVGSAIPLYFPNQVTVRLRDGSTRTARVDLPVGSFCSPAVEQELAAKFAREGGPSLGAAKTQRAFDAGLALESHAVSELASLWTASR